MVKKSDEGFTNIRVPCALVESLNQLKKVKQEPYYGVIERLVSEKIKKERKKRGKNHALRMSEV